MKPFDLEAVMRGEPIITRDGRPAKFVAGVTHWMPLPTPPADAAMEKQK